jgi:hypothetical protein
MLEENIKTRKKKDKIIQSGPSTLNRTFPHANSVVGVRERSNLANDNFVTCTAAENAAKKQT